MRSSLPFRVADLGVEWRDLIALSKAEMTVEIVISLPALLLFWGFA